MDVDTGVDDAMALLLAFRSPEIDICGVSCVSGNTGVDTVVEATLKVLDAVGAPLDLPVGRGCSEPLVEPQHSCPQIHGNDSLGDLVPPLPTSTRKVSDMHAVPLLVETLKTSKGKVVIMALAPLTNIAMAIRLDPQVFKDKVKRIVWMGGGACIGGNATAWAEANACYDPEAAHIVLGCGIPITMYTWDMFLKVQITREELKAMGLPGAGVESVLRNDERCRSLGGRLLHRDMDHFGMESACIGDAGAVAVLVCPSVATTQDMHVAVELAGTHTRGMTVCDLREFVCEPDQPRQPSNVTVVTDVNNDAVSRLFCQRVLDRGLPARTTNKGCKMDMPSEAAASATSCAPTIHAEKVSNFNNSNSSNNPTMRLRDVLVVVIATSVLSALAGRWLGKNVN